MHQHIVLFILHDDPAIRAPAVDVPHRFIQYLVHQLRGGIQVHAAILNARNGEQILHQIDQPHGFIEDIRIELTAGGFINDLFTGEQYAGIAGDGGQGRAQIVGDGAQEVCAQLLIFGEDGSLLLFSGILFIFQRQRALAQHGQQHAVFKGIQRIASHGDTHHAVHPLIDADGEIQALGIRVSIRSRSRVAVVLPRPFGNGAFPVGQQRLLHLLPVHRKADRRSERIAIPHVDHHIPVQQLDELSREDGDDLLPVFSAVEQLVGIEQYAGAIGRLRRLPGVLLQADRQGAGHVGSEKHHGESEGIARVEGVQRKARLGENEIEHQHAQHGGDDAVDLVGGDDRRQQNAQNVDHDDVGVSKAEGVERHVDQRDRQQYCKALQGIRGGKPGQPLSRPPGTVEAAGGAVRNDVNVHIRHDGDEPVRERRLAEDAGFAHGAATQHNLGHAGKPGEFRDLIGHIVPLHRFDGRAQFFGEAGIGVEAPAVFLLHGGKIRRLHIERRQTSVKGLRHACGGVDDLRVGGRGGQAHEDMLFMLIPVHILTPRSCYSIYYSIDSDYFPVPSSSSSGASSPLKFSFRKRSRRFITGNPRQTKTISAAISKISCMGSPP